MPGIFGLITNRSPDEAKAEIDVMLSCVKHEPHYVSGSYSIESLGLYIGWVVHKGSFSDCMPIIHPTRNLTMFFSGQNFPDENLLKFLKSRGHTRDFRNASYLLDAYYVDEQGFFSSLNGWFCGVIADVDKGEVILFNDRYGVGRLYIYESFESLFFASEAKALLKIRKELRQIDLQGLGEFFACGCALENRTLFKNISLLPGGSLWKLKKDGPPRKAFYFKLEDWEKYEPLTSEAFYEELDQTFARILPQYAHFSKPTAISLTGGLDTRMILAYLDDRAGNFPCFTFACKGNDTFDLRIARSVAHACGQPHSTLRLDSEFFANLSYYAERTVYISDGSLDVCGAHDLYLNAIARKIAPTRLTGKFGSEILRGVRMLKAHPPTRDLFEPYFRSYVDVVGDTLKSIGKANEVAFAAFFDIPWYEYGCLFIEQSQLTLVTPYMDNDLVRLVYCHAHNIGKREQIPIRCILKRRPELLDIPTDRGYQGSSLTSWLSRQFYGNLLFKGDWFFHYMPHQYSKIGAILERLHVHQLFFGRHFMTNYRAWFRNELKDYIRDVLLNSRAAIRDYINNGVLEKMVNSHIKGESCYLNEINKALTAELIHKQLINIPDK